MNTQANQYYFDFASEEFCIQRWRVRFEQFLTMHPANGVHDLGHLRRVWSNCKLLLDGTSTANLLSLLAMAYLHDLVDVSKGSTERSRSSTLSAERARSLLAGMKFPDALVDQVIHGISAHSYSAGIAARTIEAKVLSDADKIDALGTIGFTRLIYTAGAIGSDLFDLEAPLPLGRTRDDTKYAIDHVFEKLVRLPDLMYTDNGRALASARLDVLLNHVAGLLVESGYTSSPLIRECVAHRLGETAKTRAAA